MHPRNAIYAWLYTIDKAVTAPPQVSSSQKHLSSHTGGPKRGVTFKTGLIADKEDDTYYGPLLNVEDVSCDHGAQTKSADSLCIRICRQKCQCLKKMMWDGKLDWSKINWK